MPSPPHDATTPSAADPASGSSLRIALRIAAATLGGYAFAWGFIAVAMASLFAAGAQFHDAEFLSSALGLLLFLAAFLWAFAARSLGRVWIVLGGGGALMAALAALLQHWLT